jgi:glycerol-3-phosphate dehydrogenase
MSFPPLPISHPLRDDHLAKLTASNFDVAIIGGGINGACLYHYLKQQGYKTALLEAHDFGSGTSQNSGMMIWGGLLYLQNFDFTTVYQFSRARDYLIKNFPTEVIPKEFHFVHSKNTNRNKYADYLGFVLYWLLSHGTRRFPKFNIMNNTFSFEEGLLTQSDARFTLSWLNRLPQTQSVCVNYFKVNQAQYNASKQCWELEGSDRIFNQSHLVQAKYVVNACGVWSDQFNMKCEIKTNYKHLLSKGVYLNVKITNNDDKATIYEMGQHQDVITYIPWGPIALWGPTETTVNAVEDGFVVNEQDIDFLIEKAKSLDLKTVTRDNIVSTRCGIRPLVVESSYENHGDYTLKISRKHQIEHDRLRPWITIFGGKLSGCTTVADEVTKMLLKKLTPSLPVSDASPFRQNAQTKADYPDVNESMKNEYCYTLDDYLRRRTNMAQWIENSGLGSNEEQLKAVKAICLQLCLGDPFVAEQHFNFYYNAISGKNVYDKI